MGESEIKPESIPPKYWVVIPAAGVGKRMREGTDQKTPKQYLNIRGLTILEHTLTRISQIKGLAEIVLPLDAQDAWWSQLDSAIHHRVITTAGGQQRAESVLNGLQALQEKAHDNDWVLVHDAVRPCVSIQDINNLIDALSSEDSGGLLATPVKDTLKKVNLNHQVECTVPREEYWLAATPQMFRYGLLRKALEKALADSINITDEAHAMENAGHRVKVVQGSAENIKITRPEDLYLAEQILIKQASS